MYTQYLYKNSLCHHGIQGQKWGVRRFQNSDGSLTPEGKLRYNKNLETAKQDIKAAQWWRNEAKELEKDNKDFKLNGFMSDAYSKFMMENFDAWLEESPNNSYENQEEFFKQYENLEVDDFIKINEHTIKMCKTLVKEYENEARDLLKENERLTGKRKA